MNSTERKLTKKLLGHVTVDVAMLIVGDPYHILPSRKPDEHHPEPPYYDDVMDHIKAYGHNGQIRRVDECSAVDFLSPWPGPAHRHARGG